MASAPQNSFLFSFAIGTAILFLVGGSLDFPLIGSISAPLGLGTCVALAVLSLAFERGVPRIRPSAFLAALLLLFVSNYLSLPFSFFQGPSVRGELILLSLTFFFILRALSTQKAFMLLGATLLLAAGSFLLHTNGKLLLSDDHSVFLFRLKLLQKNFPHIPFYYPLWNAGLDARDFFATGSLNVFALAAPLLYLIDPLSAYNIMVMLLLTLLVPACTLWAARIEELSWRDSAIAATLSLCTGLLWYRWGLKYGTLGFVVSTAFLPLVLALSFKVTAAQAPSRSEALGLAIGAVLMCLWPAAGIVLAPLALIALIRIRSTLKLPYMRWVAAAIILTTSAFAFTVYRVSNVGQFLTSHGASHSAEAPRVFRHAALGIDLNKALSILKDTTHSTNPLLVFLGPVGLLVLPRRARLARALTALWLLFLGTVAVTIKPQLELDRMLVMASLWLCVPTAALIGEAIGRYSILGITERLGLLLAGGFLLTGPFCTAAVFLNRTVEQYGLESTLVPEMAEAIRHHAGGGRVLFTGFVLHELSEGHLAPLSEMTGVPLIASSPFHNRWRYTQVFPESFLERGRAGVDEYLDYHNVSLVLAHERSWRDEFYAQPGKYENVWRKDRWSMFRRKQFPNSYLQEGQASLVEQTGRSVIVIPQSSDLVLRFQYFPFLRASACTLSKAQVAPEVSFIRLSGCPTGLPVTIDSVSLLERIGHAN